MAAAAQRMDVKLRRHPSPVVPIMQEVMGGPAHIPGPSWDLVLLQIYRLCQERKIDRAIDVTFERIDALLCEGKFSACDQLLDRVDTERLDSNLMVAFLSITAAARDKLPARARLRTQVASAVRRLKGEAYEARLMGEIA